MNKYRELKSRHEKMMNEFPMFYAFNNKQFEEGMAKLGLNPDETDKIYKLGGTGGFYRKSDSNKLKEMFNTFERETKEAIAADETGYGFIYDMFNYELANHEYCITWDLEPTLDALGLTLAEINADERRLKGFKKAIRNNKYEK